MIFVTSMDFFFIFSLLKQSEQGASRNPCSETYAGPYPFSEVETRALANFVRQFSDIKIYVSFHSYGQMLLFPYVSKIEQTKVFCDLFFSSYSFNSWNDDSKILFQGHTTVRAKNFNDMVRTFFCIHRCWLIYYLIKMRFLYAKWILNSRMPLD